MGATRNIRRKSDGLHAGAVRSRLIIGLMALILALVLGMAWQANRSVQAHNATAIGVLQDYGRLAADEYARRAMGAVGYYGYYAIMNDLRATAAQDPAGLTTQANTSDPSLDSPALYVLSVSLPDGLLLTSLTDEPRAAVREYLLQDRTSLMQQRLIVSQLLSEVSEEQVAFFASY